MTNVDIQAAVAAAIAARSARNQVDQDEVLQGVLNGARVSVKQIFKDGHLIAIDDLPDAVADGIEGVEVVTRSKGEGEVEYVTKVKLAKTANRTLLMRHLGLLNDKLKVTDDTIDVTQLSTDTLKAIQADLAAKGGSSRLTSKDKGWSQ